MNQIKLEDIQQSQQQLYDTIQSDNKQDSQAEQSVNESSQKISKKSKKIQKENIKKREEHREERQGRYGRPIKQGVKLNHNEEHILFILQGLQRYLITNYGYQKDIEIKFDEIKYFVTNFEENNETNGEITEFHNTFKYLFDNEINYKANFMNSDYDTVDKQYALYSVQYYYNEFSLKNPKLPSQYQDSRQQDNRYVTIFQLFAIHMLEISMRVSVENFQRFYTFIVQFLEDIVQQYKEEGQIKKIEIVTVQNFMEDMFKEMSEQLDNNSEINKTLKENLQLQKELFVDRIIEYIRHTCQHFTPSCIYIYLNSVEDLKQIIENQNNNNNNQEN